MAKDKDLHPIHPGEILREELLKNYQITPQQLAHNLKVEEHIIEELLNEKLDINPELSYRLGLYWGLREDYWLDLQKHYDKEEKGERIKNQVLNHELILQSKIWTLKNSSLKDLISNSLKLT